MNKIITILKKLDIINYNVREVMTETVELFFVKKQLQMRRMKNVTKYDVVVYRAMEEEGRQLMGQSTANLVPGMTDAEITAKLAAAYKAAGEVKNPAFGLYAGRMEPCVELPSRFATMSLREAASVMSNAIFRADHREDSFVNSAEVFVVKKHVRIVATPCTDVSYIAYECNGEFVTQCLRPQDVEQHYSFRYADLEADALTQKVEQGLSTVCDRARATESPVAGNYDVVLSGEHLATLLEMYLQRADAGMVYAKYSDYAPGKAVQGEAVVGEKLNLTLVPDAPYSAEGIPMVERQLVKDGVLQHLYGALRFCRYLNTEPTGSYRRVRLEAGTVPFAAMKQGCLYPVSFSDFQMDGMSGRFGGEIRLAYLYTEDGVKLLTGGSINGSLLEKQGDMTFSLETYKDADYEGPLAVCLHGVSVSGR